ncbi:PREDICTED: uncharacterized protein MAL13P1.304-like isoform X2 [Papilio polytes]|uniref:uncharacterized protein MAL13P1.304-like isoform X2 n=1 Tax=Papilio polytes TaxID=76194 RepID=UPI000676658D|nr:PREDICTED: uncharacterized protein MAL13P1.304-like isoform X2 [Papilio polytes]
MKRVKMTSHKGYFSTYQSPNIVIDPNKSNYPPIVKKMKADNRVNTNLKILQDNKMSELYTEMDSNLVKKINKDDLKKPIKSEITPNKILSNGPNKSNTVRIGENISSKIKLEQNYKPNNQRENVTSQFTSGLILNSNKSCTNNTDLNKESFKDNTFSNNIKIEPNNNSDGDMGTSNKEGNCLERTSTLTNCVNNNNTVKNEENMDINKTFKHKVKETKEENMPEKFKEATKKNSAQVNRKYSTKDVKQGKNETVQPKTIKIIINVTYNNLHSKNNTRSTNSNVDGDLSFLDDFDVDEVVESLFNGKQQNKPIINDEKVTESSKRRKTSNTEQTNTNHKEKHTSKVDNKTEEIQKLNIEKEKSPAGIPTEKNKRKNENDQIDCNIVPKNMNNKSKSNIISTERKKDSKETKKEVCSEKVKCVDHSTNKHNIGHGILNKFVTKSDKDLAHNLEIKMYDTLKQKYSVLAVTHYGKFSKIFKCIGTSGDCYAVKILEYKTKSYTSRR